MITETIYIPNLDSQKDIFLIEQTLMALNEVKRVSFDLAAKRLVVSYAEDDTRSIIKQAIEDTGYEVGPDLGVYPTRRQRPLSLN